MASNIVSGNEHNFAFTDSGALTWALGSHTNGGAIVVLSHQQTNATRPMTALTVNGVAFTKIRGYNYGSAGGYAYCEIWACNAASAAGLGTNATLAVTKTASGSGAVAGTIVTVTDVDQTLANWTFFGEDGDTAANAMSAALTGFASGALIIGCSTTAAAGNSINTALGDTVTEFTGSDRTFNAASRTVAFYGTAASSTPTVGVDSNSTSGSVNQAMLFIGVPSAVTGPTISSLGDSTPNYQGSTTITGTGFPTSQTGSAAAHLGGVAQTVTWNTSTNCSIASVARGNLAYGNYNLTVTDAAGNTSANYATSLSPQAGWKSITTSGTLADPSLRLTTTPVDIVSGNQISVGNVVGGTIDDITLYVDGSYSCAASVISFDYEVHDGTEWGAVGTEYPNSANGKRGLSRNLARTLYGSLNQDLSQ